MPIYEYRCAACRRRSSLFFQSFSAAERAEPRCEHCGSADLARLIDADLARFDDGAIVDAAVLIEADGDYWHRSEKVQERDGRKNDWCEANGFTLYRVPELAFYRDPDAAVRVILRRAEAEGLTAEKVG